MKRTERIDRLVLGILGVAILGGAISGLVAGFGAFGSVVQVRPLIPSDLRDWVASQDGRFWIAVAAASLLICVLALAWLAHQLRRVHSPSELEMPDLDLGRPTLPASVVADAVHADLVRHPAIAGGAVHILDASPAQIDAVIDVHERADIAAVKRHLTEVLGRFQASAGAQARTGRCTLRLIETPRVTA